MVVFDFGCVKTPRSSRPRVTKESNLRPGRILHARAAFCSNQSCARTTRRMVFTQPRPISDICGVQLFAKFCAALRCPPTRILVAARCYSGQTELYCCGREFGTYSGPACQTSHQSVRGIRPCVCAIS